MKENETMQEARKTEDTYSYLMAYSENVIDATLQYLRNNAPQMLHTDDEYNVKIAGNNKISCSPLNFYAANIAQNILGIINTVGIYSDLIAQRDAKDAPGSEDDEYDEDDEFILAMPVMSLVLSKCKDAQMQNFIEAIFSESLVKGAQAYVQAMRPQGAQGDDSDE
jgi:hypothetical protein